MVNINVCLVVQLYFGKRRNVPDPILNFRNFLERVSTVKPHKIGKFCFVINGYGYEDIVNELINKSDFDSDYIIISRENVGMSYAGWNCAIKHFLQNEDNYTHYFVIKDDYVPSLPDFLQFYYTPNVSFVASMVSYYPTTHASISNGMLSADVARRTLLSFGEVFSVKSGVGDQSGHSYRVGEINQIGFLEYIKIISGVMNKPFLTDISSKCRIVFNFLGYKKYYGISDGPVPLEPLNGL